MPGGPTPGAPVGGPVEGVCTVARPKLTCRGKSVRIHDTFRGACIAMAPASKKTFHTASDAEIKAGEVSDVYFQRTVEILAARGKMAAGQRQVISFGARRMHPALAPMIERNAFIGGCDGVAVTKSAELIDADPMGTIPHSLVLMVGDTVEALKAFHEVIEPKVRRGALVDTLHDGEIEALRAAQARRTEIFAVRLDTPSSRRGDLYRIVQEVRWELNLRGFGHVKIITSGGIDEAEILRLNPVR